MLTLYHFAETAVYEAVENGYYRPSAFSSEGFVHLCKKEQLTGVYSRYFEGKPNILLLTVRLTASDPCLIFEDSTGRGELFPHYYAPIPVASIQRVSEVETGEQAPEKTDAYFRSLINV
ncbi:Uncharacterized conserved protein, DUF952 family [Cyclonatronum proteinivorum]|uniref:Uncharacterized conserved protein, DUF952 family n=1 Tax=Cyclonatronum proteinivorum TaxID=1457365 RepID=A0A345UKU2_9BACT|nr:DUF952 domain-containing protein [Cyclonatronum proteinivorum]AXJ01094.1 Uncharacterized conserved protein, DUF952 family [Cyclonatronum proteinivorum]